MAPSDPVRDSERRLISCCTDDCAWAKDGYCDDGGPGAQFAGCLIGSDCHDCCGKDQTCKESRCQQEACQTTRTGAGWTSATRTSQMRVAQM